MKNQSETGVISKRTKKADGSASDWSAIWKFERANVRTNILRVLALMLVVGITIYIYDIRDRGQEFPV